MRPEEILEIWKNCLKHQTEIEIFDKIEFMLQTPLIVFQLIEQGNTLEAVNRLKSAQGAANEPTYLNIPALIDVRKRLQSCQERVVEGIFDSLMRELFVDVRPPGVSFIPGPADRPLPPVETAKTQEYIQALFVLNTPQGAGGERNDPSFRFIERLRDTLSDQFLDMVKDIADGIRVKRRRQTIEAKDRFAEFVRAYESFTPQNPLVAFLDITLSKAWVLLARCARVVAFYGEDIFSAAWLSVTTHVRGIVDAFTIATGAKAGEDERLTFRFLSSETTSAQQKYIAIRQQFDLRPSWPNLVLVSPLLWRSAAPTRSRALRRSPRTFSGTRCSRRRRRSTSGCSRRCS
jgi:hypothetical protein